MCSVCRVNSARKTSNFNSRSLRTKKCFVERDENCALCNIFLVCVSYVCTGELDFGTEMKNVIPTAVDTNVCVRWKTARKHQREREERWEKRMLNSFLLCKHQIYSTFLGLFCVVRLWELKTSKGVVVMLKIHKKR